MGNSFNESREFVPAGFTGLSENTVDKEPTYMPSYAQRYPHAVNTAPLAQEIQPAPTQRPQVEKMRKDREIAAHITLIGDRIRVTREQTTSGVAEYGQRAV